MAKLRKKAVNKLFLPEKVLQTPVIAAVLTLCSNAATSIAKIRGANTENVHIDCDVAFSGLQAIRLYMVDQDGVFDKFGLSIEDIKKITLTLFIHI